MTTAVSQRNQRKQAQVRWGAGLDPQVGDLGRDVPFQRVIGRRSGWSARFLVLLGHIGGTGPRGVVLLGRPAGVTAFLKIWAP